MCEHVNYRFCVGLYARQEDDIPRWLCLTALAVLVNQFCQCGIGKWTLWNTFLSAYQAQNTEYYVDGAAFCAADALHKFLYEAINTSEVQACLG